MKFSLLLLLFITACASNEKNPKVLWEQSAFKNPESAYFDKESKSIFVSNVAGSPTDKDNDGWITKLTQDGKVVTPKWIMDLDAPKGLRSLGDNLYVSDIDRVVVISIKKSKIIKTYHVKGAKFLNDLALDMKGNIYVSDMFTNKIYVISKGKVKTYLTFKQMLNSSPNGILIDGEKFYIATWGEGLNKKNFTTKVAGKIITYDLKTKELLAQSKPIGNLDGIEKVADNTFIVSDWMAGKVFKVENHEVSTIYTGKQGTADIGLLPGTNQILIPQMKENKLINFRY